MKDNSSYVPHWTLSFVKVKTIFLPTVLCPVLCLPQCTVVFSLLFIGKKGWREKESGGEGWELCVAHPCAQNAQHCAGKRLIEGGKELAAPQVSTDSERY